MPMPGETIAAKSFEKVLGGKGINQTIAAQRAGADVFHFGHVGEDAWISNELSNMGVDTQFVQTVDQATGHAIIFVDDAGENEIVIYAGANDTFDAETCSQVLDTFASQQLWVVLQNEINLTTKIAATAKKQGAKICYSAAPFDEDHVREMLPHIDLLAVNETELDQLRKTLGQDISDLGVEMILVTLGARGAELHADDTILRQTSFKVTPVDTTGAGDTFLGSFMARFDMGDSPEDALEYAAAASAIQVTGLGAAPAIPHHQDVQNFIRKNSK
jgi:ribokinase